MSKPRPGVVAVDAGLVAKTIVEAVFTRVNERPDPAPPDPVGAALDDPILSFVHPSEGRVEMRMRRAGYLARIVEAELFDPARQHAAWLAALLRERVAGGDDWTAALTATCADLARAEPIGKPHPDDPAASTWRIPGPGGHVRHYLARRTIEHDLQSEGRSRPFEGDPAELKAAWAYGFLLRACEEVLPEDAALDG
ncbi:MAG: hypothetical protein QOJ35_2851 [Solirubrobacteraceae bacterium]|jgi:hypothetical protein|nr:hypothetical protein [Solirubrobacteraceae bacterium]